MLTQQSETVRDPYLNFSSDSIQFSRDFRDLKKTRDGLMDERTDKRTDERTYIRTDGQTNECTARTSPHSTGLRPLSGPLPCLPP